MTPPHDSAHHETPEFAIPSLARLSEGDNPVLSRTLERALDDDGDEGKNSAAFASFI
ncbi:hypothetical protein ACN27G_22845 [Plantactinospora sp. WMMB334]|uniref:hypothetical protein n=1 Tax=Plantactinospora sp. WMMB334 TaxID=3404119 RepID=UPI003B95218E